MMSFVLLLMKNQTSVSVELDSCVLKICAAVLGKCAAALTSVLVAVVADTAGVGISSSVGSSCCSSIVLTVGLLPTIATAAAGAAVVDAAAGDVCCD